MSMNSIMIEPAEPVVKFNVAASHPDELREVSVDPNGVLPS